LRSPEKAQNSDEAGQAGSIFPHDVSGSPAFEAVSNANCASPWTAGPPGNVPQSSISTPPFPLPDFSSGALPSLSDLPVPGPAASTERPIAGYPGLTKFLSIDPDALIF